jgi:hypothetical protein
MVQKEVSDRLAQQILAGQLLAGDAAVLDKDPEGDGLVVRKTPVGQEVSV